MVETRPREKHGMCDTPEYMAWQHMKDRCSNPNYDKSKNYLGRGVTVCERWLDSFINFYEDMGDKPTTNHSLDREDNNGDYDPSNCRWATNKQQVNNRRALPNSTGYTYIHRNHKGFLVRIKRVCYGTHDTIKEAIVVRDKVLDHGNGDG